MAVLQMRKIDICALRKDRKSILETLQRIGAVEVSDIKNINKYNSFDKIDTFNMRSIFDKNKLIAQNALNILDKYEPENKNILDSINSQKEISKESYYAHVDETEETMKIAREVVRLSKEIDDKHADIVRKNTQIEALSEWKSLDISMDFKGTKKTKAFIGTLPQDLDELQIKEMLAEILPDEDRYTVDVINRDNDHICIFVLSHIEASERVLAALRSLGFSWPNLSVNDIPAHEIETLENQIKTLNSEISACESEIKSYKNQRDAFKFMIDYHDMRSQKYEVISKILHTKNVFMLSGYIPKKFEKKLESILVNKFNIAINFSNPDENDDVPVVLQNNKFASPVESVVEGYSLPGKGEVDPTSVMAIFYYILFGMMLSDAAYGAIIVLICSLVLIKFKNIKSGLKKSMKMFLFCGISTTFWGVMFGSYFGDIVDVVSSTFFGVNLTIPALWFMPLKEPMRMLAFSFGIGILHVFAGLFMRLYELIQAKNYKEAIYDVISWYLLVGGLIIYMMSMPMVVEMLVLSFKIPTSIGTFGLMCAGIGALIILFTAGRESKNPFKRFLKGLYGLYGVTGYLSDILSYSRLLALGLATGVIAQVFNKMGTMAGNGVVGWILFILVFIIGHTMNIAINLLGAYVHTNRLQFVEFFGKFYEGGGRKFSPFFVNTKYFTVVEDINQK